MADIIIDKDFAADGTVMALHRFPIDDTIHIPHPSGKGKPITPVQFLMYLNGKPDLQAQCGFAVLNQYPDEERAITRWQRILARIADTPELAPLQSLNLRDGE